VNPSDRHELRRVVPVVLGRLIRRHGNFHDCEDALQEALVAAALQWPADGRPANPTAWLTTVATRRLTDRRRADAARRRREARDALADRPPAVHEHPVAEDDTLTLLFLCCHPALTPPSQVALTLRAVGGLTTAEIARAFLVPEATMAQRISRAKQQVRDAGATFGLPDERDRPARVAAVLAVLYLMFNEGYTASSGAELVRPDITAEAIRLTRMLHRALPDDGEVAGLLALMLLTEARRRARIGPGGALVPLADQDRSRWDREMIAEGTALITRVLQRSPLGPYQLQAAIAAVHDEAPTADDTDWPQILALYGLLERVAPNPVVTLNRAVAVAMVHGPRAGLRLVDALSDDDRLATSHRHVSVRAHLLELAGERDAARAAYEEAARRTLSIPERRYLVSRAARLR
jgi:RNA polymerase sigma factor (sigma-70 family)